MTADVTFFIIYNSTCFYMLFWLTSHNDQRQENEMKKVKSLGIKTQSKRTKKLNKCISKYNKMEISAVDKSCE